MQSEIHLLSWLGALLLAGCAIPQAVKAKKDPSSTRGLSWWFLWAWFVGEWLMLLGLCQVVSVPVLANYLFNIALIWYLLRVKMEKK